MDIVAAEIVSDQALACFPWGKGKIAPVIMKKWRGEARFSLAFLCLSVLCAWHHTVCILGGSRGSGGWPSKMPTQVQAVGDQVVCDEVSGEC